MRDCQEGEEPALLRLRADLSGEDATLYRDGARRLPIFASTPFACPVPPQVPCLGVPPPVPFPPP